MGDLAGSTPRASPNSKPPHASDQGKLGPCLCKTKWGYLGLTGAGPFAPRCSGIFPSVGSLSPPPQGRAQL